MVSKRKIKYLIGLGLTTIIFGRWSVQPVQADWSMVAANPQRTSWTSDQVSQAPVEWYRVIEPYIEQHVQPVLATTTAYPNGLVYISTSKGMYTYRADTGALVWSFPTELPLGNSPTYSNGVVYVGSFNRNLYALNADTGAVVWTYSGAKSGFDTNPLVVDGNVILGNRDGAIYAVSVSGGTLVWKYQTGGPVRFSSAYKGGVVYTVSNDGYLYANQSTNGTSLWKSQTQFSDGKMRGDGFYSYWPVVYTDTGGTGKDYILVAGSEGYRAFDRPGALSLNALTSCGNYEWCEWLDEWNGNISGTLGSVVTSESWALGRQEVNFINTLSEYFATGGTNTSGHYYKSWRRFYYVFDASNGQEYSMPAKDGTHVTYLPVDPILSNSGDIYPPVIGSDNLIYLGNHWDSDAQSRIMGWKFGTSKMVIQGLQQAGDEPYGLSAGGNLIYRNICCDRAGDSAPVTGSSGGTFWSYNISDLAPGYDNMWWGSDWNQLSRLYGNYGRLSTLLGGGLSVNGVYHEHGDQSPLIPFKGRVYTIKSNALIVFGSAGGRKNLAKQTFSTAVTSQPDYGIDLTELKARLETEVQKMVTAGHLRPGYYNAGMFANSYPWLNDYFSVPGDTIYALSVAYPYLSTGLQSQVKTYLANEFANFDTINWHGAKREWLTLPQEVETDMTGSAPVEGQVDKYYAYALWKYATNVAPENKTAILAKANSIINTGSSLGSANLAEAAQNRNMAGDIGLAGLKGTSVSVSCGWFNRNSTFGAVGGENNMRSVNVSRNFMFLVPEVGKCMSSNPTITAAIPEYEWLVPFWFVSRYEASVSESTMQNLYDYPALFAAKAYIQKLPREQLVKYLDVPAFKVGDLFYIQNLVTAIEAPGSGTNPTATPGPSVTPGPTATPAASATPTPTPATSGPPGGTSGWTLTFSDEFSGSSVDTAKWATQYLFNTTNDAGRNNGNRSLNDEMEWYVDNADVVSGGVLSLKAGSSCATTNISGYSQFNCSTWPYTSGMIASFPSFSQRYGYFEARMKIPSGQGLWPAFWLMPMPSTLPAVPAAESLAIWPPEIDIMENKGRDPTTVYLTNIYCSISPYIGISNSWCGNSVVYDQGTYTGVNYSAEYHNYGIDWEPGYIDWYIDGVRQRRVTTGLPPAATGSFSGKMYVIANLALGGAFSDGYLPVASTLSTKSLDIDYIRVYQKGASTTPVAVPGDANSDSHVDGLDYVIWLNNYGGSASGASKGDFNSDGKTDGLDYVIWLNNYGK